MKKIDMTNWVMKEHGVLDSKITVLNEDKEAYISKNLNKKRKRVYWRCQCECGKIFSAEANSIKTGASKSCGCLVKERMTEVLQKDITNQKFGKLTAIKNTGKKHKNGCYLWLCECECGSKVEKPLNYLMIGDCFSCGCIKSKGESIIQKLLQDNMISFETQKTFDTCKNPLNNYPFYFDFYIENSFLLEFDGEQHFHTRNGGWNNEENFSKTQERDKIKNQWCKNNNIPLKRIPYWELNNLTIEDILNDKYLIKES